jgi:hypothetical protein
VASSSFRLNSVPSNTSRHSKYGSQDHRSLLLIVINPITDSYTFESPVPCTYLRDGLRPHRTCLCSAEQTLSPLPVSDCSLSRLLGTYILHLAGPFSPSSAEFQTTWPGFFAGRNPSETSQISIESPAQFLKRLQEYSPGPRHECFHSGWRVAPVKLTSCLGMMCPSWRIELVSIVSWSSCIWIWASRWGMILTFKTNNSTVMQNFAYMLGRHSPIRGLQSWCA